MSSVMKKSLTCRLNGPQKNNEMRHVIVRKNLSIKESVAFFLKMKLFPPNVSTIHSLK